MNWERRNKKEFLATGKACKDRGYILTYFGHDREKTNFTRGLLCRAKKKKKKKKFVLGLLLSLIHI